MAYANEVGSNAESIYLVHGEPDQSEILSNRIVDSMGIVPVIPARGETFEL